MRDITQQSPTQPPAPRSKKRDVHGWVVVDKSIGITSTQAVSVVKRAFHAKKAGHAGTLDPLASGILPVALGDDQTVPFVMEGARHALRSPEAEPDTDDAKGDPALSTAPPQRMRSAFHPRFTGAILQVPPLLGRQIDGEI
jgi:tRNA pseudouridine55 synthase